MSFFYTQIHNHFSELAKGILPLMSILHVPNTGITFPWVYSGKTSQQVVKKCHLYVSLTYWMNYWQDILTKVIDLTQKNNEPWPNDVFILLSKSIMKDIANHVWET